MASSTTSRKNIIGDRIVLGEEFKATDAPMMKDLQILRTGKFTDPRYKKFTITQKMFSDMIKNFTDGVRGVVPALDYAHDTEGRAAGWLKKLFTKKVGDETQLWGSFELTPGGQKTLADKDYAYLSADFDDSYVDNEEGKNHGCVLLGAALTNRPVIKDMSPAIQLSEVFSSKTIKLLKENPAVSKEIADLMSKGHDQKQAVAAALNMDRKGKLTEGDQMAEYSEEDKKKLADHDKMFAEMAELHKALGAKDHADAMSKVAAMAKKPAPGDGGGDEPDADDKDKQMAEQSKKIELAEKRVKDLEEKAAKAEKETKFTKMLSEGKACEAQRAPFMKGDMEAFAASQQAIKTGSQGHGGSAGEEVDVEDEIRTEAKKLQEADKKLSLKDAVAQVLKTNKSLAEKRRKKQE